MSFVKSKGFKYLKNLIIGVGAAVVLLGALFKIESWPYATEMLTAGLITEAGLFLMLGILGPDKDYYWDKLYPGLDEYDSKIAPITAGGSSMAAALPGLNGEVVEGKLTGMLSELQVMSKSMSSLKALQDADFSGASDQIKQMNVFYGKISEAMGNMADAAEDAKSFKAQMAALSGSMTTMNASYGNMAATMTNMSDAMNDTKAFKEQMASLSKNMGSLNSVYGGMLSAMSGGVR
jgi:hypothetical protein